MCVPHGVGGSVRTVVGQREGISRTHSNTGSVVLWSARRSSRKNLPSGCPSFSGAPGGRSHRVSLLLPLLLVSLFLGSVTSMGESGAVAAAAVAVPWLTSSRSRCPGTPLWATVRAERNKATGGQRAVQRSCGSAAGGAPARDRHGVVLRLEATSRRLSVAGDLVRLPRHGETARPLPRSPVTAGRSMSATASPSRRPSTRSVAPWSGNVGALPLGPGSRGTSVVLIHRQRVLHDCLCSQPQPPEGSRRLCIGYPTR